MNIEFKGDKKWTQLYYYLFSGVERSKFNVEGEDKNLFNPSQSSFIGGGLDISSPKIFDKTFFTIEAWYSKKLYQGYAEERLTENARDRTDYLIDISYLKIPMGFRYSFLQEAQTPYIKMGVVKYLNTKSLLSIINERERSGIVTTDRTSFPLEKKNPSGYWVSAGFSKIFYPGLKGFIELRYEKTDGFIGNNVESVSNTKNFSLTGGIRF